MLPPVESPPDVFPPVESPPDVFPPVESPPDVFPPVESPVSDLLSSDFEELFFVPHEASPKTAAVKANVKPNFFNFISLSSKLVKRLH